MRRSGRMRVNTCNSIGHTCNFAASASRDFEWHGRCVKRREIAELREIEMKKAIQIGSPSRMPRTGLEPARVASLPPQSSASANSATWAMVRELYAVHLACRVLGLVPVECRGQARLEVHDR